MVRRNWISCFLGIALVISTLMVAYAPLGYATSYTATTTSSDNTITAQYGVLSVTNGLTDVPLGAILKTTLNATTSYNTMTNTGRVYPESITLRFSFSNLSSLAAAIVIHEVEYPCTTSNGSGSVDIVLSIDELEEFGFTSGACTISYTVKLTNNSGSSIRTSNNASLNVTLNAGGGTLSSNSPPSISKQNISANQSLTKSGTVKWTASNSNYSLRYDFCEETTGSIDIIFSITGIKNSSGNNVTGCTIKTSLGGSEKTATVSGGAASAITYTGLTLSAGSYSDPFSISIKKNSNGTISIKEYDVSITAVYSNCNATNHGYITTTIHGSDDAVSVITSNNPDLIDQGYNVTTGSIEEEGYSSISITADGQTGITDENGDIDLDLTIPSGVDFVFHLTNTYADERIYVHITIKEGNTTRTNTNYNLNAQYTSRFVSYKDPIWMYSIDEINSNNAWISGSSSDITISITGDDIDVMRDLRMELVFKDAT